MMTEGEKYVCPNQECGYEIKVTQGPKSGNSGDKESFQCCCGQQMKKTAV